MARSGKYTHRVNKRQLIKDSLIEAGVIQDTQPVDGNMYAYMGRRLNDVIKALQAKGLHLWRVKDVTLLLEKDKLRYGLGVAGDRASESVNRAVLTGSVAIAATTYAMVSTNVVLGDFVGLEMTDGEMWWTTVATVPDAASITVTTGPTTAAIVGAVVYSYTALSPKPLRILEAYTIQAGSESNKTVLRIVPREEWMRDSVSESTGYVNEIYFRPDLDLSYINVSPASSDNLQRIVMTVELPLDNMDVATDDLALPDWWYEAMHLRLSHAAARRYRAPIDKVRELKSDAKEAVKEAEDYNVETTYIQMAPTVTWTQ
jgi:hypothetical protein